MRSDHRGSWYLLTGVILGAAIGLVYSWLISPVKYIDAPPYALRADYKDEYRALVASAFLYSNDLIRANARLAQLKDDDPAQALTLQVQRAVAEGRPNDEIQALRSLLAALSSGTSQDNGTVIPPSPANSTPTISALATTPLITTPTAIVTATLPITPAPLNILMQISTSTPLPTHTASASYTPGGLYALQETRIVCDVNQSEPLIEVDIRDAAGEPVPSVEVFIMWEGGKDHFFTGLQPELGLGYADFVVVPGVVYSIQITGGGQIDSELSTAECSADNGSSYWGSWYLIFMKQ